jgi:hypothetical protein
MQNKYFIVDNREFFSTGMLIKICGLVNGWYENVEEPEKLIEIIKNSQKRNHIFTFYQRVPNTLPRYKYYMDLYPVSVIKVSSYENWFKNCIGRKTRQAIKTSEKKGIKIKVVAFDEKYIKGISDIYNETPIRAGKKFPHYRDSIDKVKTENATFFDRSVYLGAYYGDELVGFSRIIIEDEFIDIVQLLSKTAHRDKCINNALLSKIVEICSKSKVNYIAYGDYDSSSLGNFKRHNGFIRMDLPRYYIPLNSVGIIAIKLKLHRRVSDWLPEKTKKFFRDLRKRWNEHNVKI